MNHWEIYKLNMTFAIVKQLLSSGHVGMANYCLRQNITTRGYALSSNVLSQAVIRHAKLTAGQ